MSALGQLQRFLIANRHARDEQQVVRSGVEEPSLTIGDLRKLFEIAVTRANAPQSEGDGR